MASPVPKRGKQFTIGSVQTRRHQSRWPTRWTKRSESVIATLLPEVRPYARALVTKAAANAITIKVISGLRNYDTVSLERFVSFCFFYLAVIGSALTFLLLYWLLPRMTVARLQAISLITPLGAVMLSWLLGGENVSGLLLVRSCFRSYRRLDDFPRTRNAGATD
jgi:EamA-like transporter family